MRQVWGGSTYPLIHITLPTFRRLSPVRLVSSMASRVDDCVTALHRASHGHAVVAVTGGGVQALSWLLCVPGASHTILEAIVPYSAASLAMFLRGAVPSSSASAMGANLLARMAYSRAKKQASPDENRLIGVGASAALQSDHERRGANRVFVATCNGTSVWTMGVEMEKGTRSREQEDDLCSRLVLNALLEAMELEERVEVSLGAHETLTRTVDDRDLVRLAVDGDAPLVTITGGVAELGGPSDRVTGLLCGSFNPLHKGHRTLVQSAERVLRGAVGFELCVRNVDKPTLTDTDVRTRLAQFNKEDVIVLTQEPRFVDKARMLAGQAFVCGYDTAKRLVDPKYYPDASLTQKLRDLKDQGARFVVGGRATEGSAFCTLDDVSIPVEFQSMFHALTEEEFRIDISSTELRKRKRADEGT